MAPNLPGHPDNELPLTLQGPNGGPLPEYWISRHDLGLAAGELNDRQPADPTGSHGWGAMPLLWLHEYLLGVTIAVAGGSSLEIRPVAAGLPYVTGTTVTPLGPVHVHFEPSEPRLVVELPAGVTAQLHLPPEFAGTRVVESADRVPVDDARQAITIGGGRWVFECRGPAW